MKQEDVPVERRVGANDEKDELNEFFDEFERTTGGENFRTSNR